MPADLRDFLAMCDGGGVCVPDRMLESGGAIPPQQCTAFDGPGVCLSRCIPDVAANAGLLRRDVCSDADELCVPCTDPRDGTSTGACELIELARCVGAASADSGAAPRCDDPATCEYEAGCAPVVDPSVLPACADDAHCLDEALVTASNPDVAGKLSRCESESASELCVPDVMLRTGGKFIPPSCTSIAGAEGRCLSRALPDVASQEAVLPQDICAATERCVPCYDVLDGSPTGACALQCDPGPSEPSRLLASCCDARGRCVPDSAIDDDARNHLDQHECGSGELCVPDQMLGDAPYAACTATSVLVGPYTGVCLSDCVDVGVSGLTLARGSCSSDHTCVPCTQFGRPTGAPGC